jgi:glutamate 5-kinase
MSLIRAMQTDEIALVLTAILARFQRASAGPEPDAGPGGRPDLRAPVAKALEQIDSYGYELTRRLALEIINLFPAATIEAMLGTRDDEGHRHLRARYSRLSSDLSFIDRTRLVVY